MKDTTKTLVIGLINQKAADVRGELDQLRVGLDGCDLDRQTAFLNERGLKSLEDALRDIVGNPPVMFIKTRKDLLEYIKSSSAIGELKATFKKPEEGDYTDDELVKEIADEAVCLIAGRDSLLCYGNAERICPDFGEDWGPWLDENLRYLIGEASRTVGDDRCGEKEISDLFKTAEKKSKKARK
jgi:hypothetical protein